MLRLTQSEENYLKAIFTLSQEDTGAISTNDLAEKMCTKASSVTDMLKKLSEKQLLEYQKYQGCELTTLGNSFALAIIRKHRLWETFLVSTLHFGWDEVHDIAEQLEHIQSTELTDRLDEFLGFPKVDPHGEPIPNKDGKIESVTNRILLSDASIGMKAIIMGVEDDQTEFLQYLSKIGLNLGTQIHVLDKLTFDGSILIEMNQKEIQFSTAITKQISIKPL
ncbi:metal-dependent transcriptional regulator [Fluviicola taffensis]|uniref:Transcriptional regulator MntR n=1 Tax=Fluviicola taffensis (strain DSM 16823 / NCIMB 13979 / RW262) TaxID=755732 RepID=F2IDU0_FLUTR|nr:metal-dependent transcriptional regulator [Fluviicola taffensis]AEA44482.1 iron (metal) dependent repressor, DtxR family [Fluviicola taffensis DSM 16823]